MQICTQMGSSMKRAITSETVVEDLKNWHKNARRSLSLKRSTPTRRSYSNPSISEYNRDTYINSDLAQTKDSTIVDQNEQLPSNATTSPEIVEEQAVPSTSIIKDQKLARHAITSSSTSNKMVEENPKIIARGTGTYDGEISFGSSWKMLGNSKHIGEITSIVEEDAADNILTSFDL